jgi:hypothetical protein
MCRNIKVLFNFEPPATDIEITAAAEQYVRKISGFSKPSRDNQKVFNNAVKEVVRASEKLLFSLTTDAAPKDRQIEAAKRHARAVERFGPSS